MFLAGPPHGFGRIRPSAEIQAKLGLVDPRLKHSGVTAFGKILSMSFDTSQLVRASSFFATVEWNAVARPFLFHFGHRFACRQTDWRKILGIVAGRVDDHFRGPGGGPLLFLSQRGIENNPRELFENLDI